MRKNIFYAFFIGLVVFIVYIGSLISFEERQKPANIPQTSFWVGGLDGGVWVNLDEKKSDTLYYFTIYFENGGIWEKGWFSPECVIKEQNLQGKIKFFDGTKIEYNVNGKSCYFIPVAK